MNGLWFSPANRKPRFGFIALHGLGASCDNLVPFAAAVVSHLGETPDTTTKNFDANDIQHALERCQIPVACILPQAPTRPVSIANGMPIPAWFDVYSLGREAKEDREGLERTRNLIHAVVAKLNQQGIADKHIFIGGFSQGGMVALHCLCCEPNRFAGVFALSSCLLRDEPVPTSGDTPVGSAVFAQIRWPQSRLFDRCP